jgi:hypothetical protein
MTVDHSFLFWRRTCLFFDYMFRLTRVAIIRLIVSTIFCVQLQALCKHIHSGMETHIVKSVLANTPIYIPRNMYWHVGLYIFVITTPWGWHIDAETCSSLCTVCYIWCITEWICWKIYWFKYMHRMITYNVLGPSAWTFVGTKIVRIRTYLVWDGRPNLDYFDSDG